MIPAPSQKKSNKTDWLTTPFAAFLCLAADFLSKRWAETNLSGSAVQPFIPKLLNFNLTSNTGAAFSIGKDSSMVMTALASVVTVVLLLWYISREKEEIKPDTLERTGIGFIFGGALGNLLDRFMKGSVTDFLDFAFMTFPVFNVADAMIDVGIGLILISMIRAWRNDKPSAEPEQ